MPLRALRADHVVETAFELGWATFENGEPLSAAEREGFDVFVTTDRNLQYQQDLQKRKLAIVVLSTPSWPRVKEVVDSVVAAVDTAGPGSFVEVSIP